MLYMNEYLTKCFKEIWSDAQLCNNSMTTPGYRTDDGKPLQGVYLKITEINLISSLKCRTIISQNNILFLQKIKNNKQIKINIKNISNVVYTHFNIFDSFFGFQIKLQASEQNFYKTRKCFIIGTLLCCRILNRTPQQVIR